ncbi:MAG: MATE family efflux transporter [Daejeonella sp.]
MTEIENSAQVSFDQNASVWQHIKNAIAGTEADYTEIPLKKAIFLLAVPMILELVMESTFAVVDIYFVSKLGASAVATVGLTETYLFLLYSIAMGLAMAVTAIIARRIGEKNKENAALSAIQAIFLAILASLPFSIGGIFFAKELLGFMGARPMVRRLRVPLYTVDAGWKYGHHAIVRN